MTVLEPPLSIADVMAMASHIDQLLGQSPMEMPWLALEFGLAIVLQLKLSVLCTLSAVRQLRWVVNTFTPAFYPLLPPHINHLHHLTTTKSLHWTITSVWAQVSTFNLKVSGTTLLWWCDGVSAWLGDFKLWGSPTWRAASFIPLQSPSSSLDLIIELLPVRLVHKSWIHHHVLPCRYSKHHPSDPAIPLPINNCFNPHFYSTVDPQRNRQEWATPAIALASQQRHQF